MSGISYVGPRAPTPDEREQLDRLGYERDVVLFEWQILGSDQVAWMPIPQATLEAMGEDAVKAEAWPRIQWAFGKLGLP